MTVQELIGVTGHAFVKELYSGPTWPAEPVMRYSLELLVIHPYSGDWAIYSEFVPHLSVAAVSSAVGCLQDRLVREDNICLRLLITESTPVFADQRFQNYLDISNINHYCVPGEG